MENSALPLSDKCTQMYLTNDILEMIDSELNLRLELAKALRVSEEAIKKAVKRKSKTLMNIESIDAISAYTSLKKEDILTAPSKTNGLIKSA